MRAPHKNLIAILFWSASFYLGKIVGSIFAFQNNVENFCVVANRSLRFTGGCGLGLHPLLFFYGGIIMGLFSKKAPAVLTEFDRRVYGCNLCNENGTSRASYIARLKPGQDLFFKPAPTKDYPDTVGVFTKNGEQIGFLHYTLLNELRGMYVNNQASVTVASVDNSPQGLGVTMHIIIYK